MISSFVSSVSENKESGVDHSIHDHHDHSQNEQMDSDDDFSRQPHSGVIIEDSSNDDTPIKVNYVSE
jgi:hypothetical protein